jgi:hypothetical protein
MAVRERLRAAALRLQPWKWATGPRTVAGKQKASANGRCRQHGPLSTRAVRAEMADVLWLIQQMRELRQPC